MPRARQRRFDEQQGAAVQRHLAVRRARRSPADLADASYGFWFKPTSADADETLLYFGGSTNYLKLVARDASGYPHLTMSVGGVVKELVSSTGGRP